MDNKSEIPTSEKKPLENTPSAESDNTRIVKINNSTLIISHHYSGNCTYEELVKNAINREAENR